MRFPFIGWEASFLEKAAKISIGADVVEPMVMDADMSDMRRHEAKGSVTTNAEHFLIIRCVELEDCRAVLESLRPLGPTAGGVFAFNGEDRGAVGILPALLKVGDLWGGGFEDAVGGSLQGCWREGCVDRDHG